MTAMLYRAGSDGFQRLLEQRLDELGEAVAGPVEPALDGPQIAAGDVRDLRVALPLELAQHEHGPMVDGELPHALVHGLLEIPLAVAVIRPAVLELVQRYALLRTRRDDGWRLPLEGCSHVGGSAVPDGNGPGPRETALLPQKRHELYRSV